MKLLIKPPITLTINGTLYPIHYDFETWIQVTSLFDEITDTENIDILFEIINIVFGNTVDEPVEDILAAVSKFSTGYPFHKNNVTADVKENVLSFEHDINNIVIAIKHQSGIDLRTIQEPFHWWDFLLEFQNISDDCLISKIMGYRGYTGKDKDMNRLKQSYKLPLTKKDLAVLDKVDDVFWGC